MIRESEKIDTGEVRRKRFVFPSVFSVVMTVLCLAYPVAMLVVYFLQLGYYKSSKADYMAFNKSINNTIYEKHVESYRAHALSSISEYFSKKFLFPLLGEIVIRFMYPYFMPPESSIKTTEYYGEGICTMIFSYISYKEFKNIAKTSSFVNYVALLALFYALMVSAIYFVCRLIRPFYPRNILRIYFGYVLSELMNILLSLFYRKSCLLGNKNTEPAKLLLEFCDDGTRVIYAALSKALADNKLSDVVIGFSESNRERDIAGVASSWFGSAIDINGIHPLYRVNSKYYIAMGLNMAAHIHYNRLLESSYAHAGFLLGTVFISTLIFWFCYRKSTPLNGIAAIVWINLFMHGVEDCTMNAIKTVWDYDADRFVVKNHLGREMAEITRCNLMRIENGYDFHYFAHKGHIIMFSKPSCYCRTGFILNEMSKFGEYSQ